MVVCGVALAMAVVCLLLSKKHSSMAKVHKPLKILCAFSVLGLVAGTSSELNPVVDQELRLKRNPHGEGAYEVELQVDVEGVLEDYPYQIKVQEKGLSAKEEKQYLDAAIEELEKEFAGRNKSRNEVRESVKISDFYQDGKVKADWTFDNYEVVDFEGNIRLEKVPEEGILVGAVVELSCEDTTVLHEFSFHVFPKILSLEEEIIQKLNEELTKECEDGESDYVTLPKKLETYRLTWVEKKDYMPEKMLILGGFIAFLIPMVKESKRKEAQKELEKKLLLEYPTMVSKLTLLLGSGVTLFTAWNRIATTYCGKRKKKQIHYQPVYEEMLVTLHEMKSGLGEAKAYERFGERINLRQYRKFSSLISQNLQKGTKGLNQLLQQEAEDAFEERKNLARKYGEEAGSKLLLPMMMMFGVVVFIIMVPAVISFQM